MNFKKFAEGGYLETEIGSVFLRAIGSGPPLIVIHGGPGLDHTYLLPLRRIARNRTLIFYDQLGCGRDKTGSDEVSADSLIDQLVFLVQEIGASGDVGFLAHSWGSYVALSFLERSHIKLHPNFVILSNPCPINRVKYDEVGGRLLKRIPAEVMSKIGDVLSILQTFII
ncbi:MAG: alpha/beta fold hydrolase [Woronichinia naegeliana WA131]|uniref:Alpha/beta fold hydrolase n=1 Tax=Woronichinia naegeliana WA131 TaxID=2824559 RepID=A0A977L0N5_9CYAN|nr:MAG: alpha/beta fold hydrolase [Woronichinia naegeliana WA131]